MNEQNNKLPWWVCGGIEYAPVPWHIDKRGWVMTKDNEPVFRFGKDSDFILEDGTRDRIKACMNACEGVPTEGLDILREMLARAATGAFETLKMIPTCPHCGKDLEAPHD